MLSEKQQIFHALIAEDFMPQDDHSDLSHDAITRDYRIYQRRKGHRYSIDDVLVAYVASQQARNIERSPEGWCDLGTGIGSVLLMSAWAFPSTQFVGVEAQEISYQLLQKNVVSNGLQERVQTHFGDLRDEDFATQNKQAFDIVTGTPPYFAPGSATPSPDEQKTYARIEMRGGVDAYIQTAAKIAKRDGIIVVGSDMRRRELALRTGAECELRCSYEMQVVPREGQSALFAIWVFQRLDSLGVQLSPAPTIDAISPRRIETFVARDKDGVRSDAYVKARAFFGLASGS